MERRPGLRLAMRSARIGAMPWPGLVWSVPVLLLSLTLLVACGQPQDTGVMLATCVDQTTVVLPDADHDGLPEYDDCGESRLDLDCNDHNAEDLSTPRPYYLDSDRDGYGGNVMERMCDPRDGYSQVSGDANEQDASIYPGAYEYCDGKDNNQNGKEDDVSGGAQGAVACYPDLDGDGFPGSTFASSAIWVCTDFQPVPTGYTLSHSAQDCQDSDSAIYPGAEEVCDGMDNDCLNDIDEDGPYYLDADGDGYPTELTQADDCMGQNQSYLPAPDSSEGWDCQDKNAAANPGMTEICATSFDDDCNGLINNQEGQNVSGSIAFYLDKDDDGYGGSSQQAVYYCDPAPEGYSKFNTDCNDTEASLNPGVPEVCDGIDNDCDGLIDDGVPQYVYYTDLDGDSYCGATKINSCQSSPPAGTCVSFTDCLDSNVAVHPGAAENCDGLDNDCDGSADEGYDDDLDGHLDERYCSALSNGDDCDDSDHEVYTDAPELCDLKDNDCNGLNDEGFDQDNDGFLDEQSCSDVYPFTDCNDQSATINPGATEVCNNQDDDCDDLVDAEDNDINSQSLVIRYVDADHDTHGFYLDKGAMLCPNAIGFSEDRNDCDDAEIAVYASAPEVCNDGLVNDCLKRPPNYSNEWAVPSEDPCSYRGELLLSDLLNDATKRVIKLEEESVGSGLGTAVSFVRDVNQDGTDDVLLGAPRESGGAGAAYVVPGSSLISTAFFPNGQHTRTLNSGLFRMKALGATGAHLGFALSGAGAVVGNDEIPDLWIGAPGPVGDNGVAWLISGVANGYLTLPGSGKSGSSLAYGFRGPGAGRAGWSVAYNRQAGTRDDPYLLVGSPWADTSGAVRVDAGQVYLLTRTTISSAISTGTYNLDAAYFVVFRGDRDNAYLGMQVGTPGALYQKDDQLDLLVTAPGWTDSANVGRLSVYDDPLSFGNPVQVDVTASTSDASITGAGTDVGFGRAFSSQGDLNGDGYDDVAIGAPDWDVGNNGSSGEGAVHIFKGPLSNNRSVTAPDVSILGLDQVDGQLGYSIASGGDFNCDGYDDLAISAPTYTSDTSSNQGRVFIFFGSSLGIGGGLSSLDLLDADVTLFGAPGEHLGVSLALDADLDSNSSDALHCQDLLIGAPGVLREDESTSASVGAVYVLLGRGF